MLDTIIDYSVQSLGLLPLMALIFAAGLAIIIERLRFFAVHVHAARHLEHDVRQLAPGNSSEAHKLADHYAGTLQGEVVRAALDAQGQSETRLERVLEETIMFQMPRLDRNLWVLDTAVTLGPLLGLLGTLVGMIESFGVLGVAGTSNPNAVTGGIAHALIATAFGLAIAIVCVVFLNYFNKRIRLAMHQMDLAKSMLVSRLGAEGMAQAAGLQGRQDSPGAGA